MSAVGAARSYEIAGIPCVVNAEPAVLDRVDKTYGGFRAEHDRGEQALTFDLASGEPLHDLFNRITEGIVGRLSLEGIYPIHAAALEHDGGALILSGRSNAGKTTLALRLLQDGLKLLSDELALSGPAGRTILPYRRSLHVRPGTPELIEELAFLARERKLELGGGIEWSLLPSELESVFPGCLGSASELSHVVLLGARAGSGTTARLEAVPAATAAVELVSATPAAAANFAAALDRMARLTDGARCVRLHPGSLEDSAALILEWLGADAAP
ncbi:MAG TPA: hypothetical protein VGM80_08125 [Gaiellaceae bacterium]